MGVRNCKSQQFWIYDPLVLITCFTDLWPWADGISDAQAFNALSRMVIIIAAIMAIMEKSIIPILGGLGLLIVIAVTYTKYKSEQSSGSTSSMLQETSHSANAQPYEVTYPTTAGATTVDYENQNPYGNPGFYDYSKAVRQAPLGEMTDLIPGDQFIDKLFTGSEIVPPGLNFNRIPDTTHMAREPYPLSSMDMSTRVMGETDNSGSLQLRYM